MTARSSAMVTLHDTRSVKCRWFNDGWTVKTVVTWQSSASMIPRPPRWPSGKASASRGEVPACVGIFSGSSHTSDLKNGIPVATLPGAWRYRVSTGTGRPGVSIL